MSLGTNTQRRQTSWYIHFLNTGLLNPKQTTLIIKQHILYRAKVHVTFASPKKKKKKWQIHIQCGRQALAIQSKLCRLGKTDTLSMV